jgi:hypothetical protein
MDFSKLSMGAKLALIGGAVLVIDIFLPWYGQGGFNFGPFDSLVPGFDIGGWLGLLAAIAGAVVLVLKAFGKQEMKAGQFKTEQLAFLLAAGGLVLIVIRWLSETSFVKFGLYIAIIAAAAVAYGAFTEMKSKGQNIPGMK